MKAYAGIGSRETPSDICALMAQIAAYLERRGWTLRSGGADGADTAFERGVLLDTSKEIFLPWSGFNRRIITPKIGPEIYERALRIAERYHPAWSKCGPTARKLHTRNVFQVLGADLETPSKFIVCWTKDGKASGGTGQAMRIAADKIPIFNLRNSGAAQKLKDFVEHEAMQ